MIAMSWTSRDELRLTIKIGLRKGLALVRGMRRAMTDVEQDRVADAIADHLKLANYSVEPGPPLTGHGQNFDFRPAPEKPSR